MIRQDNIAVNAGDREADAPIPEAVDGGANMNAYRGFDVHGVDADTRFMDVPGYNGTEAVVYEPEPDEPEPIPVRVVRSGGSNERKMWRTYQSTVSPNNIVTGIIGRNDTRTTIRVKNTAATAIVIGMEPTVTSFTGYPLAAGETVDISTTEALYAINSAVTGTTIAVLEQYALAI